MATSRNWHRMALTSRRTSSGADGAISQTHPCSPAESDCAALRPTQRELLPPLPLTTCHRPNEFGGWTSVSTAAPFLLPFVVDAGLVEWSRAEEGKSANHHQPEIILQTTLAHMTIRSYDTTVEGSGLSQRFVLVLAQNLPARAAPKFSRET